MTVAFRATGPVASTGSGRIRGIPVGDVVAFLGVPYAAPPVGSARFAGPARHPGWTGTLEAHAFGAAAPQPTPGAGTPAMRAVMALFYPGTGSPVEGRAMSEDCLTLNVWAPREPDPRAPVMVWLHGGGFATGTGAERWFHGDRLAARGVVVVTINHRLGLLGYLPPGLLPDAELSGVAGMLDIVMALRWVRENVASMGGDPDNVTVFGQSGGGVKTLLLATMPAARGLLHRMIVQSAPSLEVAEPDTSAIVLRQTLAQGGLEPRDLRAAGPERIVEIQAAMRDLTGAPWGAGPVLHARELPEQPLHALAVQPRMALPLLAGSTTHDSALRLLADDGYPELTQAGLRDAFVRHLGDDAELTRYAATETIPQLVLARAVTDREFGAVAQRLVAATAPLPAPVFHYRLDHRTDVLGGILGSLHSHDLPLVFDTVDRSPITGSAPERHAVAGELADRWVSFARTGNPTATGRQRFSAASDGEGPHVIGSPPSQ